MHDVLFVLLPYLKLNNPIYIFCFCVIWINIHPPPNVEGIFLALSMRQSACVSVRVSIRQSYVCIFGAVSQSFLRFIAKPDTEM